MKKVGFLLIFLLLGNIVAPCSAVSVIPKPVEKWTCYDHAVNFNKENPDWGIVTLSTNQWFRGQCHIVNYRFVDNETLLIHDCGNGDEYPIVNWQLNDHEFYHFWTEGTPTRHWTVLQDNREKTLEMMK